MKTATYTKKKKTLLLNIAKQCPPVIQHSRNIVANEIHFNLILFNSSEMRICLFGFPLKDG